MTLQDEAKELKEWLLRQIQAFAGHRVFIGKGEFKHLAQHLAGNWLQREVGRRGLSKWK